MKNLRLIQTHGETLNNSELRKAIIYIIASAFCFNLMNVFVRLSGDIPSIEKSFFRNLVAALVAVALFIYNTRRDANAYPDK